VADEVSRRAGLPLSFRAGSSYRRLSAGEDDVAAVCGLPYVQLAARPDPPVVPLVAPVLAGVRYGGRPVYFSDVVVAAGSPARSFADLRGRRWAYNEPRSQSGVGVVAARLAAMGETWAFFGELVEAGSHQRALAALAAGEADGAAVDSHVLEVVGPGPSLRTVDVLGPSTVQPVVASSRLPAATRDTLRDALLAVDTGPISGGRVARFVPVGDGDYADIRAMAASAAAGGVGRPTPHRRL
jgi:phosphonate transport system substrate-binding protein